jgi:hypothetical protein
MSEIKKSKLKIKNKPTPSPFGGSRGLPNSNQ